MLNWKELLLRPKKPGYPKKRDVLASALIHMAPDSGVSVDVVFGTVLPRDKDASVLCLLVLYQAVNIWVSLVTEPDIIQDAYPEMMTDILNHWPKSRVQEVGSFAASLPYIQSRVDSCLVQGSAWAANGGETIELKLAQKANKVLYLYDYYPGMPGCGPPGLAVNLITHYIYLVDFALSLLTDGAAITLGVALSELWAKHLSFPLDALQTEAYDIGMMNLRNRSASYEAAFSILQKHL